MHSEHSNDTNTLTVELATAQALKKAPATLSLKQFAAFFGKQYLWAWRMAKEGKISTIGGYGPTMVPKSEIVRILNKANRQK